MSTPYFTLIVRDGPNDPWHIAFGDYDRRTVEQERKDSYSEINRRNWAIARSENDDQDSINAAIKKFN